MWINLVFYNCNVKVINKRERGREESGREKERIEWEKEREKRGERKRERRGGRKREEGERKRGKEKSLWCIYIYYKSFGYM